MAKKFLLLMLALLLCSTTSAKVKTQPEVNINTLTAKAWLVADVNGNIIDGINMNEVRSIASITKLASVIVVIDSGARLDERVAYLHNRHMTRQQLIDLAMIHSDNNAARLLCETYRDGYTQCIHAMNNKARVLGMYDTVFTEPTGLFNNNVSTALDLLKLVIHAANYPQIVSSSNKPTISLEPLANKRTKKSVPVVLPNTNSIVSSGAEFMVSKTGWIRASGGCIVMTIQSKNGWRTVILLGSKSTKTRIPEAKYLAERY